MRKQEASNRRGEVWEWCDTALLQSWEENINPHPAPVEMEMEKEGRSTRVNAVDVLSR